MFEMIDEDVILKEMHVTTNIYCLSQVGGCQLGLN